MNSGRYRQLLAVLVLGMCSISPRTLAQDERYSGWPAGWVATYQRFENFIAARKKSGPQADLAISENGQITHGVRITESATEHLSLRLFHQGDNFLTMGMVDDLMGQGRSRLFPRGTYAACIYASGPVGYQHVYPMVWFEVKDAPAEPDKTDHQPARHIETLQEPAQPEERWPNERLLLYLDFDIFPNGHPFDIEKANRKVSPAVSLTLDRSGAVTRDILEDAAAESLLQSRVYRDGVLVKRGGATGASRLEVKDGPGFYHVFLAVEGPTGVMPVSNLVTFRVLQTPEGEKLLLQSGVHTIDVATGRPVSFKVPRASSKAVADPDDDLDGDGLTDQEEAEHGTNTFPRDTDLDGVKDSQDSWPKERLLGR